MLALAAAILAVAPQAGPQDAADVTTRTLRIAVTTKKGQAVTALTPQEVVVTEDGVTRPIRQLVPDERRIDLALIVDTSAVFADTFRQDMVGPLVELLKGLPQGTRFTLWTSGLRPKRCTDLGSDPETVDLALKRVIPEGGNVLFDTIDEALSDLAIEESERRVVVIVTGMGVEFSAREIPRAAEDPEWRKGSVIHAVRIEVPPAAFERPHPQERVSPLRRRGNYERALDTLTSETGGRYELIVSPMGVGTALERIGAEIVSGYLLTYETTANAKPRKLRIKVDRPKVRVRYAPAAALE